MSILVESKANGPDVKSAVEPTVKYDGLTWYDTVNKVHKIWNAVSSAWVLLSSLSLDLRGSSTAVASGNTGVFGGGVNTSGTTINNIDYVSISTPSNSSSFGNLTLARSGLSAGSNGTNNRGLFGGGSTNNNGGTTTNTIDYVSTAITNSASAFGTLSIGRNEITCVDNNTNQRAVFGSGYATSSNSNVLDYVTVSTLANATGFGQSINPNNQQCSFSNGTNGRGVFGGGQASSSYDQSFGYITIATTGNATVSSSIGFNLIHATGTSNGTSNRGIHAGGWNPSTGIVQSIYYVTITSLANSTSFNNLSTTRTGVSSLSNGANNRAIFGGGTSSEIQVTSGLSTIEYIGITTTGTATNFGNLTTARILGSACSNA